MATLNVIVTTTGEKFEVKDIDFTLITPKDILTNENFGLPSPEQGKEWRLLKGSTVVDNDTSLDKLGFKDGDKSEIMGKVIGAFGIT